MLILTTLGEGKISVTQVLYLRLIFWQEMLLDRHKRH